MARLLFGGDDVDVRGPYGAAVLSASGRTGIVYLDAAGTTLADIVTYPAGAAIAGSVITVSPDSQLPLFQGPADGTDTLYVSVDGHAPAPIYTNVDARLDLLATNVAGRLNWRGAWAATTAYATNDLVTFNGGLYRAPNNFTSAGAFVLANWVELHPQIGTYASDERQRAVVWPGKGRGVLLDNVADFTVYGANLGIGPLTIDTAAFWGASWDWTYVSGNIDKIAKLGCNSIRVQGNYTAYAANASQYKTRFVQLMEYCRTKGLRVLYCFLNNPDDTNAGNVSSTLRTQYAAMIADLATAYAGDKLLLGWDIGNELSSTTSDTVTMATNFAADLRAVDATTKITCSIPGQTSGLKTAAITTWDSIVDFHDMHIYSVPDTTGGSFAHNWFDDMRALTAKPILVGEFGANFNPSAAGGPHMNSDETQVAQYVKALRRYAGHGDLMGFMIWQIRSDTTSSDFGLYDVNGNVRQALVDFSRYPRYRVDAAKDAVDYRASPVLLDNFGRADSNTSLGTAPMGGAWTAGLGTWGLASHVAKIITGAGGGHNAAILEANTADVDLEAEIQVGSTYNVGIIYRYVDSTHFGLLQFLSTGSSVILYENNAGTFTARKTTSVTRILSGQKARIRVDCRGGTLTTYLFDRVLAQFTGAAFNLDATKHGIYVWSGGTPDVGSVFARFSARVPGRTY